MKFRYIILLSTLILTASCSKQGNEQKQISSDEIQNNSTVDNPSENRDEAKIVFEEYEHDWGEINEGETVLHTFKFKNEGTKNLVISNVQASCGCTTPEWTKEPVEPAGEGKIVVKFSSTGKGGLQKKTVTVYSNSNPVATELSIKTFVNRKE